EYNQQNGIGCILIEDGKVRQRAAIFVDDWKGHSHKERQEAAQFEAGFLNVFLRDFSVGRLEYQIRIAGKNRQGYADLFWPSVLLLEMKSTDAPDFLDGSADEQAFKYARTL
ncbi:MAG: hypothetical protein Q4F72_04915, partial [Desulfovibrionaceae bacterium]|nr:hypothetical protein [Desulfovibrionaceae bacterium]